MGAWGTSIFSDDIASDIRNDYKDLIGDGLSSSEATDKIISEWDGSIDDSDDGPVIWLALAVTQWKLGRLEEHVKNMAIEVIDSGCNLERWTGKDKEKRRIVLEKTKKQLESPQPPVKKIPKRFRDYCDWEIGEMIAYTTLSKEKILFRIIGFHVDAGGKSPVCELLDWKGEKIPAIWQMRFMKIKKKVYPNNNHVISQLFIGRNTENELPIQRIERLGVVLTPSQKVNGFLGSGWRYLDDMLKEYFDIE